MLPARADDPLAWKPVQDAIQKGLPKSAIQAIDRLLPEAIEKKDDALVARAIAMRASLDGQLQGRDEVHRITRLQSEIPTAPESSRPILRAIMANWLWGYYQQNQWRFQDRTEIDPGGEKSNEVLPIRSVDDLSTWSRQKIVAQATLMFEAVLADADQLQKMPIQTYDALLVKGNAPNEYRPTLYDFVVADAIEFAENANQTYGGPAEAFELPASSPSFGNTESFIGWDVPKTDQDSPLYRATVLYQQWLAFHRNDTDPSARLDADLHRLIFAKTHATGDSDETFELALQRFVSSHGDHRISARAQFLIATQALQADDPVRARSVALAAVEAHSGSVGASQCQTLVQQIEAPALQIATERMWNPELDQPSLSKIDVTYKNLKRVYFRLVPVNVEAVQASLGDVQQYGYAGREALLAAKPVAAWSVDLPETMDYRQRLESVAAKVDVPRGGYFLIASSSPEFPARNEYTALTEVWVSNLSLIIQAASNESALVGYLVDGKNGLPIRGADVQVTGSPIQRNSRGQRINPETKTLANLKTDADGRFEHEHGPIQAMRFLITKGKDSFLSDPKSSYGRGAPPNRVQTQSRSFFFTDRSIYRPGQVVKFKVIATRSNPQTNQYTVAANEQVLVEFLDANNKVADTKNLRTNEHGSCHGSFNIPAGGLTGRMALRVNGVFRGSTSLQVEEYKRPKFEVELSSPEKVVALNQDVTVPGTAKAYTGAAIDGAKVTYNVTRQTQMPAWFGYRCWWMPTPPAFPTTIATGETQTDGQGRFDITFPAIPDNSVDRDNQPVFRYEVVAEVTDTTGETRTDTYVVPVGYTTINASMSVSNPDWLTDETPVTLQIQTRTLQGMPIGAKVAIELHSLKKPERIGRAPLPGRRPGDAINQGQPAENNLPVLAHDPNSWPKEKLIQSFDVEIDGSGNATTDAKLTMGIYRAELTGTDPTGQPFQAVLPIRVIDPDASEASLPIANFVASPSRSVEPGETFKAVWGSGYATARAYYEILHRGEVIQSGWTPKGQTQFTIEQLIDESMRGGLQLSVISMHENRLYADRRGIEVPWSNKELSVRWEHFTSKLKPGQTETWNAVIEGTAIGAKDGSAQLAEMVATLYDASLDQFKPHRWASGFGLFYRDYGYRGFTDENHYRSLRKISNLNRNVRGATSIRYRTYPNELMSFRSPVMMRSRGGGFGGGAPMPMMMADSAMESEEMSNLSLESAPKSKSAGDAAPNAPPEEKVEIDLSNVSARTNLNETAFFFPELTADENGAVSMKFTMPESLTRWQLIGFAHTNDLSAGSIRDTVTTSKDLMVQPNPPRVVREGDRIEMTVKVTNQSATVQTGTVALQFSDARTGDSVDTALSNTEIRKNFEVAASSSQSFSWSIEIPDSMGFLTYKAVGSTGRLSDGEEGYLPVLSRRILVHESIALPVNGAETKTFSLDKLVNSKGTSIDSESLTVQMTSNPAWYAVMSLPYLMEFPHECGEQTFNRLYANLLARHIANSDPKIERVFKQWRNQPVAAGRESLESPLQQNEEIASIALSETPWVLEAESESEGRRNVGILFDSNRVNDEVERTRRRIADMQLADGSWPWFPGGSSNSFITLYLTTGFGRLRHLGVETDMGPAIRSLEYLDQFALKEFNRIEAKDRKDKHLSSTMAMYLYGRSFFLDDVPINPATKVAVDYWLDQAAEYWLKLPGRMCQAHAAVALNRFGRIQDALPIVASLKERSVTDELGMHWNDQVTGWFWYQSDIESQAMMIEAFDEVVNDQASVEACKAWLLRQKETRSWKTTKGTADAIYALLLRGTDLLSDQTLVDVKMGETMVDQSDVEAGTGFYQQRITGDQVTPEMGAITVTKTTPGIAWGGVHWKFFQNFDEVTPHEGTPLKIEKQLFVIRDTPTGEVMQPIVQGISKEAVAIGDEVVTRLIVRTDRPMEFIHLKDGRGSGTEPVNVLSGYRFQDGIGYYQSTRDAAEHFFIDYLPKGTFVLQSRCRVQLGGEYQSGLATIESMYAPQYNSHSESHVLKVGPATN